MNSNPGIQNVGLVAWDGDASYPRQINTFRNFGFVFEAVEDIATDAVFKVEAAPPDDVDRCAPGEFTSVPEISICSRPAIPGTDSLITIPAGTKATQVCSVTLPCVPDVFARLVAVSGDTAKVKSVLVLQGPMAP